MTEITWAQLVALAFGSSVLVKVLDILCDYRPGAGIRLSPHFYTRDDELDAAVAAIEEILAGNAWRAFTSHQSTVT